MSTIIRPYMGESDAEELHQLWSSARSFLAPWQPAYGDGFYSVESMKLLIERDIALEEAGTDFAFAVVDEKANMVGRIVLSNVVRGNRDAAQIGYWIHQDRNGEGHGTHAIAAMLDFAFNSLWLWRVEAATMPKNERSAYLLERNDFVCEGHAKHYMRIGGMWQDHDLWGIDKMRWNGGK